MSSHEATAGVAPESLPEGSAPEAPRARDVVVVTPRGGRFVAWAGFLFGSVMSIAANVLFTWLPADAMPPGWMPPIAAQIGAAVWPVGLLISVEVLSRVRWPDRWTWKLARYGGAGVVALGSAVISYGHLNHVLTTWEYGWLGAAVGPLVLDGLMVVSGFALLAMGDHQTTGSDRSDHRARTTGSKIQTASDRDVVHADAEVVRTAARDADRPELEAGPDHVETTEPDHPEPGPDLRSDRQTAGSDHLLDEAVRWAAEQTGPISQRAVRNRFGVGRDRAVALLDHIEQTRRTA